MALLSALKTHRSAPPYLAVAVTDCDSPESLKAYSSPYPLCVELRADLCKNQEPDHILSLLRAYASFPRLLTVRAVEEGGQWDKSEEARLALYVDSLPETEGVDIELSAEKSCKELVALCKDQGKTLIGSFHDFKKTPDSQSLDKLLQKGKDLGTDLIKIAACCNSPEDLQELTRFLLRHPQENLIVLGMGREGVASRLFFPALGSLLSYTFIGQPSAPGQFNLSEMLHLFTQIYPRL
ncbi:MAG: type I 3-dehydroquinate dehydratase [Candidatus Hydrogenedens sp.]|jgi:3-dehydroquinate dehydratase-1|nr:type I 3-dehydroquinate dehydratase [Candidatus Hydrogenedens sp.]